MIRICPNPIPWDKAYRRLLRFSEKCECTPPSPPKPLILNGWVFSNDVDKKQRWEETIEWAQANGREDLVTDIPDTQFYFVDEPTTYEVGPLGGPMSRPWDFETKSRPTPDVLERNLQTLVREWPKIVGNELAAITHPVTFTGKKARRLLVRANNRTLPPWGGWTQRSSVESERRTFTNFRSAINAWISPHQVDHVEFLVTGDAVKRD